MRLKVLRLYGCMSFIVREGNCPFYKDMHRINDSYNKKLFAHFTTIITEGVPIVSYVTNPQAS